MELEELFLSYIKFFDLENLRGRCLDPMLNQELEPERKNILNTIILALRQKDIPWIELKKLIFEAQNLTESLYPAYYLLLGSKKKPARDIPPVSNRKFSSRVIFGQVI
ncbi:hypothetical protein ACFL35_21710 [Candidatus Riflebacteria bacterium]